MTESGASASPRDYSARMPLLAVELVMGKPTVMAIAIASDLVVADMDTPATTEVAALYRGSTLADSQMLLITMDDHGIGVPPFTTDDEKFTTIRRAFGHWGLPLSDFEHEFYPQIAEWNSQGPFDRQVVILLDQLENETHPERRATLEAKVREIARTVDPH
jgi:hypothetical protein